MLDPHAPGLEAFLESRRVSGLDRLDEVWEGVLHLVPAPNYGHARLTQQLAEILGPLARDADLRVPDGGLHRPGAEGVWLLSVGVAQARLTGRVEGGDCVRGGRGGGDEGVR